MTQPPEEAEGLEALWRVSGVSPLSKAVEAGVWCPQVIVSAKFPAAQEELSWQVQASFPHLPLSVPSGPPATGQCHLHSKQVCSSHFTELCANYLWKHFTYTPRIVLHQLFRFLSLLRLITKITHHTDLSYEIKKS
ncbi:Hypothetical predicted protein [Marmota monax]|uniref:Uncharacterized protein n=1 Tax=Marmota monax TaxID=9995 RepID=A0A5E4D9D7_MARMO|nr:Hypothetical predicted protein [Marmota monax]